MDTFTSSMILFVLAFGVLIWAGIFVVMWIVWRRLGPGANSTRQREVYLLPLTLPEVHVQAMQALKPARLRLVEAGPQSLKAATSLSWWSWGIGLEILLEPRERQTLVTLSTTPAMPTQLVDFGQSRNLLRRLTAQMGVTEAQRVE